MNGEKLSQEEIDALLREAREQARAAAAGDAGSAESLHAAANPAPGGDIGPMGDPVPTGGAQGAGERSSGAGAGSLFSSSDEDEVAHELTEMERDVLAEVANISMGSAATAASALVNRKVVITAPRVAMSTPREVWEQFEQPTLVVEIHYLKGLEGKSLFILGPREAGIIADLMMGGDGLNPPEELDELHLSAVTEAMNQMMGASSTAMANFFGFRVDISAPNAYLTHGVEDADLLSTERMVAVYFRLSIEGVINNSHFMQVMPIPFAHRIVEMALQQASGHKEPAAAAEAALLSAPDSTSGVAGYAPGAAAASTPAASTPTMTGPSSLGPAAAGMGAASAGASPGSPTTGAAAGQPSVQPATFPPLQPEEDSLRNVSLELIRHIPVEVSATLGEAEMNMRDVMRLATGAIVHLNTEEKDLVRIFANGVEIARGEVVVVGEQYGVRIVDIVSPVQRLDTLRRR